MEFMTTEFKMNFIQQVKSASSVLVDTESGSIKHSPKKPTQLNSYITIINHIKP